MKAKAKPAPASPSPHPDTAYRSGVKIVPPAIYLVAFAAGMGLQRCAPLALSGAIFPAAAAVLFVISAFLGGWSLLRFFRARTSPLPIQPTTALVVTGPYRFIRNPMYLSLILLYVALALYFRVVWAIVLLLPAQVMVRYHVVAGEEKYLERKFGPAYLDYKGRVPRWLPRIRRRR